MPQTDSDKVVAQVRECILEDIHQAVQEVESMVVLMKQVEQLLIISDMTLKRI